MGDKRLPASHIAGRSCSQPEDEESSVRAADPSLGSKAAARQRRRRTSCTKAGEQPQVLLSAFPQGALPFLCLGSATGHSVDRTPSAPMGAATLHGDPNPSAPGTFAIPSSSLQVISQFFPYHHPQQHPLYSCMVLPLVSCSLRGFVNFLAPGLKCSRGGRRCTMCRARWASTTRPRVPCQVRKQEKNYKKVRKNPTNHLSQQCTLVFCTLIV